MADQKPPRLAGDDRATLLALLQYQRDSFVRKLVGVLAAQAPASPVASGTSLLWLANHMADAEETWVLRRFARQHNDPARASHRDTLGEAIERYRTVGAEVDEVVARTPNLDQECPPFDTEPPVNLRWILAHLLQETARHAGHADILRELLDESTGR